MFYNDLYSEIAARFTNWLETSNSSDDIADLSLDYLNRALSSLLLEAPRGWDYLTNDRYELTLGGTSGNECTLPTDCGVVLRIFTEISGNKKPLIYYSKDGNIHSGFRFISSFSRTAGFTENKIEFFITPTTTPYLKYQKLVETFTGSGIEYSPFPGDLLLMEAQRIRCREKGLANEWKMIAGDYEAYLQKFKSKHQNMSEAMDISINDADGIPVTIPLYSMGTGAYQKPPYGSANDSDYYRY